MHLNPQSTLQLTPSVIAEGTRFWREHPEMFLPIRTDDTNALERVRAACDPPFEPLAPDAANRTFGAVPVRLIVPSEVRGVYLHMHGGGFVGGHADLEDGLLSTIAHGARLAVVSAEYRRAPENPYPHAIDDCEALAMWLLANAQSEFGSGRLSVGGESAGSNLAVALLLRLRERHDAAKQFEKVNLMYGCYDATGTPSQRLATADSLALSPQNMEFFWAAYRGEASAKMAEISPLYGRLEGLPPALFTVGTLDPLLDDTLFMAARWSSAGSPCTLDVYPEAIHSFDFYPIEMARIARKRIVSFMSPT